MKNYYFTFGQGHWNREGFPMWNSWVRVISDDYLKARLLFIEKFSGIYMQTPQTWAFQYEEDKWDPKWYPNGEYMLIE